MTGTCTVKIRISVASEGSLGRRHAACLARLDGHRLPQGAREALEQGFRDMVAVLAIDCVCMQGDACVHGEGLKPFSHELGVEAADLRGLELGAEDQKGA